METSVYHNRQWHSVHLYFWGSLESELGTRVEISITFLPLVDCLQGWTTYALLDMLQAYFIDFIGQWDQSFVLVLSSFNNNYYYGIQMTSFKEIYGRRFHSLVG